MAALAERLLDGDGVEKADDGVANFSVVVSESVQRLELPILPERTRCRKRAIEGTSEAYHWVRR